MEKSESGWYCAECRDNIEDAVGNKRLVDVTQKRYEDDGKNAAFALFSKSLHDTARWRDAFRLYYFSPRASETCAGLAGSQPCNKPSQATEEGEPRLKLEVGDPQTAWDLLK